MGFVLYSVKKNFIIIIVISSFVIADESATGKFRSESVNENIFLS